MTRDENIAEARRLRDEGLTYCDIGQRLGVHTNTARDWVNPEQRILFRRKLRSTPQGWSVSAYHDAKYRALVKNIPFSINSTDVLAVIPKG